jgi:2-keto-4-pentenoate hydratase
MLRVTDNEATGATQLLDQVRAARAGRRAVVSGATWTGLEAAYRIQDELAVGRRHCGYKLGLISPAKQAQMGVSEPVHGRVFAEMIHRDEIALGTLIQPRVEPELAGVLDVDIPAGSSPGRAAAALSGVFLAVDVIDTVWADYRFTLDEVVADNVSGGAFALGDRLLDVTLEGYLHLYLNGRLLTDGPLAALGSLPDRLAWLADEVGGLRAGQLVFFGSPAAAVPAVPGTLEVRGPSGSVLVVRLKDGA